MKGRKEGKKEGREEGTKEEGKERRGKKKRLIGDFSICESKETRETWSPISETWSPTWETKET